MNKEYYDNSYNIDNSDAYEGTGSGWSEEGSKGYIMKCDGSTQIITQGKGGTLSEGGTCGYCPYDCSHMCEDPNLKGTLGQGHDRVNPGWGTGGGGGYFGGGSGAVNHCITGSGCGGSSYVSGHQNCTSVVADNLLGYRVNFVSSVHESGIKFLNPKMVSGEGEINEPNGDKATGHTGSGVTKITFISSIISLDERKTIKIVFSLHAVIFFAEK